MNIVFDFGAVLFTWQPQQLVQSHFPHLAPDMAGAETLARSIFHHEDWVGFDRGTVELHDAIDRIAQRLSLPADVLDRMLSPLADRLVPIESTVALLQRLHAARDGWPDLRLYFLSNMPAPYARELERRHAFLQCFDAGIFSGDVQLAKPDPEIYKLLATRHSLDPARTVFIDDMPVNVEAATAQGWRGVHFSDAAALERLLREEIAQGFAAAF